MISEYGPPDHELLEASYHTLWVAEYQGDAALRVVPVSSILSVVAMPPFRDTGKHFMYEKVGLDVANLGGWEENDNEHN
jgi:hypothetical protein